MGASTSVPDSHSPPHSSSLSKFLEAKELYETSPELSDEEVRKAVVEIFSKEGGDGGSTAPGTPAGLSSRPSPSPPPSPFSPAAAAAAAQTSAAAAEEAEENEAMIVDLKFMAGTGDWDSAFDLGVIYTTGSHGVAKSAAEAVQWWTKAAKNGVADAAYNLAVLYHHGEGIDKDLVKAMEYYEVAVALGNPDAPPALAGLHSLLVLEGGGQEGRLAMMEAYEAAADGGDADAMFKLGNSHARGDAGKEVDFTAAGTWWAQGASEGHGGCLHNLLEHASDCGVGDEVVGTEGGEKDWTRVETRLEEPLARALPGLQFLAGNLYRFGHGVERSEGKCVEYLTKSAAGNCPDALFSLGCLKDEGNFGGLEKDEEGAKELMEKASEMKHHGAVLWVKRFNKKKKT